MNTCRLLKKVEAVKFRSYWEKGVKSYAEELLKKIDIKEFESLDELKENILNGAKDWEQYSDGGLSLICDADIAQRLCTPSELKKTKNGERNPNKYENWIQCQARALFQAWKLIEIVYNESK